MTQILVSRDAEEDLKDIYDYSEATWGVRRAERYIHRLYEAFALLAANGEASRARPELGAGIRSLLCGSHLVFHMRWNDEIAIIRVLHASRDHDRLFEDYDPVSGLPPRLSD